MKKFNHSGKKLRSLFLISCLSFLWMLYFPSLSWGGEARQDASRFLRVKKSKIENVQLSDIYEDRMRIDGEEYIVVNQTKFYMIENDLVKPVKINEIALPCLVDITYKTSSIYTEAFPFHPGQRILSSVVIKKVHIEESSLLNTTNIKN